MNLNRVVLVICLMAGGVLRFYSLGFPSMWWDEILVPLTARYPIDYIVRFSQSCEIHPPLFQFIIKAVLAFGDSDFVLRFIPASVGVVSIYCIYQVAKKYCGQKSAILAAGMLAVNPFHVSISRQVRPYTIEILSSILLLSFLKSYLEDMNKKNLFYLIFVNTFLVLLHYNAALIVGSELVAVAIIGILDKRNPLTRYNLILLAGFCAALAGILPLALPYAAIHKEIFNAEQYGAITLSFLSNLARLLTYWTYPLSVWICAFLFLTGIVLSFKTDKRFFVIITAIPLVSLITLLAMKYGSFFNPWHLSFLLPGAIVAITRPFEEKFIHPYLVALLTIGLIAFALINVNHKIYTLAGTTGISKQEAMMLADNKLIGQSIFTEPSDLNALGWYLNQYKVHNAFTSPETRNNTPEIIYLATTDGEYQKIIGNDPDVLRNLGTPSILEMNNGIKLYSWKMMASRGLAVTTVPFDAHISMKPSSFSATSTRSKDVVIIGNSLVPVETNKRGVYETSISNNVPQWQPQEITLVAGFANEGTDNELLFEAWFDNENHVYSRLSSTADGINDFGMVVSRHDAYSKINIRVTLKVAPVTPQYSGGNQTTLKLNNIEVSIRPLS